MRLACTAGQKVESQTMKKALAILPIIVIALACILFFARPAVVLSQAETMLIRPCILVRTLVYPDVDDGALYSPLAALSAIDEGKTGLACWGLGEEALAAFQTVFTRDDDAMWNHLYEEFADAAVLYDSTDGEEVALASRLPEGLTPVAYEERISTVTAQSFIDLLSGHDTVIVYSPEKVAPLMREADFTIATSYFYHNAFETGETVVSVCPDYLEMARLAKDSSGLVAMPYRIER